MGYIEDKEEFEKLPVSIVLNSLRDLAFMCWRKDKNINFGGINHVSQLLLDDSKALEITVNYRIKDHV